MDALTLAILTLATWRLSYLLVYEGGPWNIVGRFRKALGVAWADHTVQKQGYTTYERVCSANWMLGRLLCCFYCTSVWVALGLVVLVQPGRQWWAVYALAVSGGASLLERVTNND